MYGIQGKGAVGILVYGFGVYGLEGQGTLGLSPTILLLRCSTLVVGLVVVIWPQRLGLICLLLLNIG